jgi:hypothetical protein
MNIIAQGIGLIGTALNALSFQRKEKKALILTQLVSATVFCIHFFMLGAYMGFLLNMIAAFRAVVFAYKDRFNAKSIWWLPLFISFYLASYILTFTVFDKEITARNLIIELLPVIGMTISTISFRAKNAAKVRILSLFNSPMWLIYNVFSGSIGGVICESLCIVSIVLGIIRLDIKKSVPKE